MTVPATELQVVQLTARQKASVYSMIRQGRSSEQILNKWNISPQQLAAFRAWVTMNDRKTDQITAAPAPAPRARTQRAPRTAQAVSITTITSGRHLIQTPKVTVTINPNGTARIALRAAE